MRSKSPCDATRTATICAWPTVPFPETVVSQAVALGAGEEVPAGDAVAVGRAVGVAATAEGWPRGAPVAPQAARRSGAAKMTRRMRARGIECLLVSRGCPKES